MKELFACLHFFGLFLHFLVLHLFVALCIHWKMKQQINWEILFEAKNKGLLLRSKKNATCSKCKEKHTGHHFSNTKQEWNFFIKKLRQKKCRKKSFHANFHHKFHDNFHHKFHHKLRRKVEIFVFCSPFNSFQRRLKNRRNDCDAFPTGESSSLNLWQLVKISSTSEKNSSSLWYLKLFSFVNKFHKNSAGITTYHLTI